MAGRVIAVANMKGGVGKTTMVVALAEALAVAGANVLVIDLDAQANASFALAGNDTLTSLIKAARTIDGFVEARLLYSNPVPLTDVISPFVSDVTHRGQPLSVSLLASSRHLRTLEREIIFGLSEKGFSVNGIIAQLQGLLQPEFKAARRVYDIILLDCAPGLSAFTEVGILEADLVLVPTIPDFLSTLGLAAFCHSLWRDRHPRPEGGRDKPRSLPWVLATRRQRIRQHDETLADMRLEAGERDPAYRLFATEIPQAADFARALDKVGTMPTFQQKWGGGVTPLGNLVRELKGVLNGL